MAENTPVEVDVNTATLEEFEALFHGKAVAKPAVEPEAVDEEVVDEIDVDDVEDNADETKQTEETDPELEAEDPEDEQEEDLLAKPKSNKKSAKDRIDELTAEKYAERRLREDTERRLADLERQLREKVKETAAPVQRRAPVDQDLPTPDDMDANGNLMYPLGQYDPDYIADYSKAVIHKETAVAQEQLKQSAEQAKQQEAEKAQIAAWEGKLTKSNETIPDLIETIGTLQEHLVGIEPNYGTYLAQTIMSMDNGPEVLYYLANHPQEVDKIVASGPTGATLALGRLEARIQTALTKKVTPTPRVTAAAVPPIATRGTGAARSAIRPDTDNLNEFEELFYKKK
jgi:hypothetical protein